MITDMKFPTKNRIIAIFATAAFLLHALLPFFAVYQVPTSQDAKNMASLFGDKVLLCTAEGFKLVSWKDLLNGKQEHKPHKQYQCALCYVAAHGQGIKPEHSGFVSAPLPIKQHAFLFSLDAETLSRESLWRKLRTRSPPVSFAV